ncbi:hypothetical protein B0T26DRAFT_792512, partial [Lasiosphaeria miniovina]
VSSADRRRVYIACKPIFTGDKALVRREKIIRAVIRKNKPSLAKLLSELGADRLVATIKGLLEENFFVSEVPARAIYPDLFDTPLSPISEVYSPKPKSAKARPKSEEVVASHDVRELSKEPELYEELDEAELDEAELGEAVLDKAELYEELDKEPGLKDKMPWLYSSFLFYKAQHLIVTGAQQLLEECCFDFAAKWMPSVLERHG